MNTAISFVVGIGSNAPDAKERVQAAVDLLAEQYPDVKSSGVYTTAPHSGEGPDYANAVVCGHTAEDRDTFEQRLKHQERLAGRTPGDTANVPLDLDLVLWEGRIVRPSDFARPYFNTGYRTLLVEGAFQS